MGKANNSIAVKKEKAVSKDFSNMFNKDLGFGAGENVDAEDIKIPKLHLAQALTPEVAAKTVPVGEYMNSITKAALGTDIEVYVMSKVKLLQVYYYVKVKKNEVKREYLGTTDYSKAAKDAIDNGVLPLELHDRAVNKGLNPEAELDLQADKVLRYYVVRTDEVAEGTAFPYIVDFKRTSYGAGTDLESTFAKMRRTLGLPSYAKVFKLSTEFIQGEFDYYVKTVSDGRDITAEEVAEVETWIKELSANSDKYKADESDDEVETLKDVGPMPAASEEGKPKF